MTAPAQTKEDAGPAVRASALGPTLVTPPPANVQASPREVPRVAEYDALNFPLICLAENLSDIEAARIAMANRARSLEQADVGMGDVARLRALVGGLATLEHQATLDLQRAMRRHPLGSWVRRSAGVGEKQAARLLASIGNPYWNDLHNRARRGPAELWAYCGYSVIDGASQKHRKGRPSNWNGAARTRSYLVAESCIKQRHSPYRPIYDNGRAKYAGLPDGHAHNRSMRLVAKAVLRDIWIEAAAWHRAGAS